MLIAICCVLPLTYLNLFMWWSLRSNDDPADGADEQGLSQLLAETRQQSRSRSHARPEAALARPRVLAADQARKEPAATKLHERCHGGAFCCMVRVV